MGKIIEDMICKRINLEIESVGGLSARQFGFRRGMSTVDAMKAVIKCREQGTRLRNTRGFCVLITLDVRNAFNSASWPKTIEAINALRISPYLVETVKSYLRNRTVLVGENRLEMTCGVPQGSKLGPLLWNIMYDGIFKIDMPEGATAIGFADDIGIVVTAWSESELEHRANVAVEAAIIWLTKNGLQVAAQKTEAVILAGRRTLLEMNIKVQDQIIGTSSRIKYLGVFFDKDLKMQEHIVETAKKAGGITRNLARVMPNIGGPVQNKRRVLSAVVNSVLLYAAPIWHRTMCIAKYRNIYEGVQRQMALRVCSAYRTVSTVAVQLLAGLIPVDLLARERALTSDRGRGEFGNVREETWRLWQERWVSETRGGWTRRLIPDVRRWTERKHGELDFHLTQILSGHGCFMAYLHRFKKRNTAVCSYCHKEDDTAEHTFFRCPKWAEERTNTEQKTGRNLTPESLVNTMLEGEENWKVVKGLANKILRAKELDEKEEERNSEAN